MRATVLLPGVLGEHAGGASSVEVDLPDGARVADVLDRLGEQWPVLGRRIRDDTGGLRRHVNVFVDGQDVRRTGGAGTPVADGAVVHVLPSVAGG